MQNRKHLACKVMSLLLLGIYMLAVLIQISAVLASEAWGVEFPRPYSHALFMPQTLVLFAVFGFFLLGFCLFYTGGKTLASGIPLWLGYGTLIGVNLIYGVVFACLGIVMFLVSWVFLPNALALCFSTVCYLVFIISLFCQKLWLANVAKVFAILNMLFVSAASVAGLVLLVVALMILKLFGQDAAVLTVGDGVALLLSFAEGVTLTAFAVANALFFICRAAVLADRRQQLKK